jgi:hypothetical protein
MLANANSLQLTSLHESVEEDLIEDKHVSILGSDLLHPLNFDFVGGAIELDCDLREVTHVDEGV